MVPTKKVKKIPYEVWHGQAPKLSYLKVWGCEALVKRDTLTKPDKLESRNVEFLKNSLITQKASESFEDLEIIQEKDMHPSIDTSLNHEENDLEIDEPQSDIILIRRSTRTRHALDHMCLYIDAEEHELGDLGEPANYKAALLELKSDKWLNPMNVEMQSMKDNETGMDGAVHTYKDRLVAKGYTQTPGINYEETFSPIAYIRAIRILIAIAAFYDYEIWQIDVKTAFLNGYLSEEVYMEQHEGDIKRELRVSCYTDAGYLTNADDLKFQSGYVFVLNEGVVDWKSAKQRIFATSSPEAEYIAAYDAFKEAV
nr:hypothetical protein [Tanacetum cinerariifolium]